MEQTRVLELIRKAKTGDKEAKTVLITENSPLVKSVIRRFRNRGIEYDDLYQMGCVGFLKAIQNFSEEFEVKFSTYAVPMIAGEIKRYLRDDGYIKISRSTKSLSLKISILVEKYNQDNCKSPTIEYIAQTLGVDRTEVVFAMDCLKSPISIYDKGDDDQGQAIMDKLSDDFSIDKNINRIVLKDLIMGLEKRDQRIIILRYFKDKTQSEIAKILKISQVQVSRLETKILEKLRKDLEK